MQRTKTQNNALHKFFSLLADKLNEQGLDMKTIIRAKIWWTPENVKKELWAPVQKAKFGTESTKDLEKQMEIDMIHENLMQILGENWGVEYVDFPHDASKIGNYDVIITTNEARKMEDKDF